MHRGGSDSAARQCAAPFEVRASPPFRQRPKLTDLPVSEPSLLANVAATLDSIPVHASDLADVLAEAFRLYPRGIADRRLPFRTPTIANVGPDGAPSARTMVRRGLDPAARRFMSHTDRRPALQVAESAPAQVHVGDSAAYAAWCAFVPASCAGYANSPAPGTELPAPPSAPTDTGTGFGNFASLALTFDVLGWPWLHHASHRRARFAWAADRSLHATGLVP